MPQSPPLTLQLSDEEATLALGRRIARALLPAQAAFIIYLAGELGAGKTCLVRGLLRELGITGPIRSPTFTLLELYRTGSFTLAHLDLYRLNAAGELEALGLRDQLDPGHVILVEWPERGGPNLPAADLKIDLEFRDEGRNARILSLSPAGEALMARFR